MSALLHDLVSPADEQDWRLAASCRDMDPDLFFNGGFATQRARTICASCPVRRECLDQALAMDEQHGVWGGLTLTERQAVARTRQRKRRPPTVQIRR